MAKLPNLDRAVVPDTKVVDYLLNPSHPGGRAKARFLQGFGFGVGEWRLLREAIVAHAAANDISTEHQTLFGRRYEVDGPLPTPDGRNPIVRVVWFIVEDETAPRLVTLVPRTITP